MHLEFYVEEPSMEITLENLIPKIRPDVTYNIYQFEGKQNLLRNLPNRLSDYKKWITSDIKILVLVDRHADDCYVLKDQLESISAKAGLTTKTTSLDLFQVINRIVVEELESWFFGDVEAIRAAYPRVPVTLGQRAPYRNPDAIRGGTSKRLAKILAADHPGRLQKHRAARDISAHMDPDRNCSPSFQVFRDALKSIPEQEQGE